MLLLERVEPLFQSLHRLLRGGRRIAVGKGHLQFLAEGGELIFQALQRRIDRGFLAADGGLEAAAEFGEAHFETLDGTRAVVGFECMPQRRDFFAKRVEARAVGGLAGEVVEPDRDRLGACLDLLQRRADGVPFDGARAARRGRSGSR